MHRRWWARGYSLKVVLGKVDKAVDKAAPQWSPPAQCPQYSAIYEILRGNLRLVTLLRPDPDRLPLNLVLRP